MAESFQLRRRAPWVRRLLSSGLLIALSSCWPELDLTGKRCSDERPCPSGWECAAQACKRPGPANQALNGGFEAGLSPWQVSNGTLTGATPGRTSANAALWKPSGTAESVLTSLSPLVEEPASGWWCAHAWVQGGDGETVTLQLLGDGEPMGQDEAVVGDGLWSRVRAAGLVVMAEPLSLTLNSPASAGARQLSVDDLALWEATDSACTPSP